MRIKALRKIYGPKFARGFRSDMTLAALKERAGSRRLDKISRRRKRPKRRKARRRRRR